MGTMIANYEEICMPIPENLLQRSEEISEILCLITNLSIESIQMQDLILDGMQILQKRFKGKSVQKKDPLND
jgi:hypothetical protein